jgi:hypothetical protein
MGTLRPISRILALLLPYPAIGIGLYLFQNAWVAIGFYHLGILSLLITDRKRPPLRNLLSGWKWTWAGVIPGAGLSGLLIYSLWPLMQHFNMDVQLTAFGLARASWILFLPYYAFLNPLLEQVYWRGYLGHPARRVRIEDVAFGGYHFFTMICFVQWPWAMITFIILTGTAWLWRQIVRETGGLFIPLLSHITADVSIVWIADKLR